MKGHRLPVAALWLFAALSACGACNSSDSDSAPAATGGSANGSVVTLHPAALTPDALTGATLRSSSFFVPRTPQGLDLFYSDYPHHECVRVRLIEGALNDSGAAPNFTAHLNQSLAYLDAAAGAIQRLASSVGTMVVMISKMPSWLSSSQDTTALPVDPGWKRFHAVPPQSTNDWRQVISALAARVD